MKTDCENLDYLDWQFVAEGRLHVVFFNRNKYSINYNEVLKIPKVRVGRKLKQDQAYYEYDAFMVRNIMINWFSKGYIQDIAQLTLSESFLAYIINTYYHDGNGRSKSLLFAPYAYIERNLLKVTQPIPPSHAHCPWTLYDRVISFEFKVKCGLKSISPFNKTSRRLKLKYSRFAMMQVLKASRNDVGVGVGTEISSYRPQQLCSKESDEVFSCLKSLLQNPQNNLKVSLNGQHKFGWGKTEVTVLHNISSLFLLPSLSGIRSSSEKERDSDFVLSLVCKILSENSLLLELQSMQLLDILDSEGAAVIYGRLVEEMGSSSIADERILERIASPDFGSLVIPDLISLSREMMASGKYNLDDNDISSKNLLCPVSKNDAHGGHPDLNSASSSASPSSAGDVMRLLLQLAIHEGMSEEEILSSSTAAFELVQGLTGDVCVDLMVAWMMGLIAKDASVIVSLQPIRPKKTAAGDNEVGFFIYYN